MRGSAADLSRRPGRRDPGPADILAVALGVPVAGMVAARVALRRVQISPLGVTRRVTPAAPRAWRLIPLLLGIAELAFFVVNGRPGSTAGQIQAFLPGFFLILAGLIIAGCALAASVAAGLSERQRPFSLLRLAGAPLGLLRRVVGLESVVPLITVAVVSIGIGLLAAQLFLESQLGYSLQPPGAGYYGLVLAGLAVALGIIAATLPLLKRITGPEVARND